VMEKKTENGEKKRKPPVPFSTNEQAPFQPTQKRGKVAPEIWWKKREGVRRKVAPWETEEKLRKIQVKNCWKNLFGSKGCVFVGVEGSFLDKKGKGVRTADFVRKEPPKRGGTLGIMQVGEKERVWRG